MTPDQEPKPGEPGPSRRRAFLQNATLLLGSVLLTLAVLEGVFRALDLRGHHAARIRDWKHALLPEADRVPGVHLQFKPYARFSFRYESNPRGYFDKDNTLAYWTNRYGLRGTDFEIEKKSGVKRVIVLGDSFTFGEGVRLEDTFCHRLQGILNREPHGSPVEVLNFGVSGWSTVEEIGFFEHLGMRLAPDLVLVVYVPNDAAYAGGLDLWDNFRRVYEPPFLRQSHLLSYLYASITRQIVGRHYIRWLVNRALEREEKWQESFESLSRGKALAGSIGARYAVCIFPFMFELTERHPLRPIHELVAGQCAGEGIPVLDLLGSFKGHPYTDLWVHPADQHPNEEAHRIAAEAMARFILEESLL